MIDTSAEKIYPLKEFSRQLKQQRGLDRKYQTIWGWVQRGWTPRGQAAPIIKLETVLFAGVKCTSFEALDRFIQSQTAASQQAEAAP